MSIINNNGVCISFGCGEIIEEVLEDIDEYGWEKPVYMFCELMQGVKIVFDYSFDDEMLDENQWSEKTTLRGLCAYLTRLNNLTDSYDTIRQLFCAAGLKINKFAEYFNIPALTVSEWIQKDSCPAYVLKLLNYKLLKEHMI